MNDFEEFGASDESRVHRKIVMGQHGALCFSELLKLAPCVAYQTKLQTEKNLFQLLELEISFGTYIRAYYGNFEKNRNTVWTPNISSAIITKA